MQANIVQAPYLETVDITEMETIKELLQRMPALQAIFKHQPIYDCNEVERRAVIPICVYDKHVYWYLHEIFGTAHIPFSNTAGSLDELLKNEVGPQLGLFKGERNLKTVTVVITDMLNDGMRTRVYWMAFTAYEVIQGNQEVNGQPFPASSSGFIDLEALLTSGDRYDHEVDIEYIYKCQDESDRYHHIKRPIILHKIARDIFKNILEK